MANLFKLLIGLFSTSRPSSLREGVMDILGGAVGRVGNERQPGQGMRDKALVGAGILGRKYRIAEQRIYTRQPYYTLIDAATGDSLGLFHQDSIEPYSPAPSR